MSRLDLKGRKMAKPITKEEIKGFVHAWFRLLDDHAPVEECIEMLASDGLEMYFPDATVSNLAMFKEWYDGVINLFFDENYCDVQLGEPQISGEQAELDVVVRWQASWLEPGTAESKRVNLVATQKWRVRRSSKNDYFGLEIVYYDAMAKRLEFQPGSDPLPLRETKAREPSDSILKDVYQQLCTSYHNIDDFRAKLLGFLPLATGGGIFFLLNANISEATLQKYAPPIGLFGYAVTLGLFAYEIYGIKKCGALIVAGKQMESQLGIEGQFTSRPRGVLRDINEPFAAGIIYPAVLAAWAFLVPLGLQVQTAWAMLLAAGIFLAGFVGMLFYNRHLEDEAGKAQSLSVQAEALIRLNERILQAEEKGKVAELERILAEDFTILRANGARQTRKEFLEAVPASRGRGRKADRVQVDLDGTAAVFTCRVTTKRDGDGKAAGGRFWTTRLFSWQESEWRCVAWQVAEIPETRTLTER